MNRSTFASGIAPKGTCLLVRVPLKAATAILTTFRVLQCSYSDCPGIPSKDSKVSRLVKCSVTSTPKQRVSDFETQ